MAGPSARLQQWHCGFYIDITLTDKGMTEEGLWKVMEITFAFLNRLKEMGGSTSAYLTDLKYKNLIDFYFQTKKQAKIAVIEWA